MCLLGNRIHSEKSFSRQCCSPNYHWAYLQKSEWDKLVSDDYNWHSQGMEKA